jgi:predicted 3-demethylubiquinone-9 3-methyltransferase (glyoxalase superfamily)
MKELITPCFWFDGKAAEAASFYCEHFSNAKITAQSPIVTEIEVSGHHITCLDGGPKYKPNPSISFFYLCETTEEINALWSAFLKEGSVMIPLDSYPWSDRYGWINDKYGISWQFSLGKWDDVGQKITPCLLFSGAQYGKAEEAIGRYSAIFKDPKVDGILRYGKNEAPDKPGMVKHAQFSINGQKFMVMDSAKEHDFTFSEGISLTVHCETQEEIDYYWEKLTESGKESMCGWLKDKFGVSWQIIPNILGRIMSDPAKAGKAAQAFMEMRKLDIEKIIQASIS